MIKEDWPRGGAQTLQGKAEKGWSRTASWHKGGSPSPVKAADSTLTSSSSSCVGAELNHFLRLWCQLNGVRLRPALALLNRGRGMKGKGGKKIHFTLKIITGLESCSREWTKSWTTPPLSNLFLILKKKRKMHHNATGATITTSPADKWWSGLSAVYKNLVKPFRCR